MVSLTFIAEHWISLIFGLISAGLIAYCRYSYKKFKEFEKLQEEQDKEEIEAIIDKKIQPLFESDKQFINNFITIRDSYKYRLIEICQLYLDRGYITTKEYSQLSEMWKVYHGLGGNSQAEDYYHKAERLPIRD